MQEPSKVPPLLLALGIVYIPQILGMICAAAPIKLCPLLPGLVVCRLADGVRLPQLWQSAAFYMGFGSTLRLSTANLPPAVLFSIRWYNQCGSSPCCMGSGGPCRWLARACFEATGQRCTRADAPAAPV
ncbi:MAG TPA: hypothetical protein VLT36_22445 [Candidatus Dormibacteraeota bacterium]|nr:hypothetical protein [Candidatus Dormibacteraeota bacterium]